jgi:amino acid transporter
MPAFIDRHAVVPPTVLDPESVYRGFVREFSAVKVSSALSDSHLDPAVPDPPGGAGGTLATPAGGARAPLRLPAKRRRAGKHADGGHDLGVAGGLAALSLDALSSVAYGPEAMILVLVAAGSGALRFTFPLTLVITGMLVLLLVSYTQVIAAHPEGGGAYAVAKINLGRIPALLAAASLVVDYVLTVAVSLAAGAASLGSVFPGLSQHLLLVSLGGLVLLTAVNMFGITESARLLLLPTAVFILSILALVLVGPFRSHPQATIGTGLGQIHATTALGIVLILKAFAAGCSAVTGVEAIANGVPAFREPRVKRAQRTEI